MTLGSEMAPPRGGSIAPLDLHCYTQNMKALWFRRIRCFYVFLMTPPGGAYMDPMGMVGGIYKEDHYTLLHTKY